MSFWSSLTFLIPCKSFCVVQLLFIFFWFMPLGFALGQLEVFGGIFLPYFVHTDVFFPRVEGWGQIEWREFLFGMKISLLKLCFPVMWSWLYLSRSIFYHFNLYSVEMSWNHLLCSKERILIQSNHTLVMNIKACLDNFILLSISHWLYYTNIRFYSGTWREEGKRK